MIKKLSLFLCLFLISPIIVYSAINNGVIDFNNSIAWGENLGWINFAPKNGDTYNGLRISDTEVTGYAWSKQYGWINFSPTNGGVTIDCSGYLGGYAWSSQLGWLSLNGSAVNNDGRIIGISGSSNDKAGRINFNCSNCLVKTDWRPCAVRSSVCGNGISESAEACDNGVNNGTCPNTCSTGCQLNNCSTAGGGGGGNIVTPPPVINQATSTIPINPVEPTTSTPEVTISWYTDVVKRTDIARDGVIDILDFNLLMVNWGRTDLGNRADTNLDGIVDLLDFNSLMIHWGKIEK